MNTDFCCKLHINYLLASWWEDFAGYNFFFTFRYQFVQRHVCSSVSIMTLRTLKSKILLNLKHLKCYRNFKKYFRFWNDYKLKEIATLLCGDFMSLLFTQRWETTVTVFIKNETFADFKRRFVTNIFQLRKANCRCFFRSMKGI